MPSKACRRKKGVKNFAQSYCFTITSPSSFPTSWAWLTQAESSTTLTRSSTHPTSVLLKVCLRRPNAQSGANLVWPTIIKLISTCLLRPAITRHAKYCIIKLTSHVNSRLVLLLALTGSYSDRYSYRHAGAGSLLQNHGLPESDVGGLSHNCPPCRSNLLSKVE